MPYKNIEQRREYQKLKMRQIRNESYKQRDCPELNPTPTKQLYTFYKIKCKNENIVDFYIGQTYNFIERIISHKHAVKVELNKLYEFIRKNGGFDNFYFEIICECKLDSLQDALDIENRIIKELNPTLNTIVMYHGNVIKLKNDNLIPIKFKDGSDSPFTFSPITLTAKDKLTLNKLISGQFI